MSDRESLFSRLRSRLGIAPNSDLWTPPVTLGYMRIMAGLSVFAGFLLGLLVAHYV